MDPLATCPVMATMGTESMWASAIGVTRFVAPGPEVAMHTPTRPVADGIPLGGVAGALLVAHEDVAHLRGVEQRVVGRQDRAAGDAEDGVGADRLEREDERLGTGDLYAADRLAAWVWVGTVWPPGAVGVGRWRAREATSAGEGACFVVSLTISSLSRAHRRVAASGRLTHKKTLLSRRDGRERADRSGWSRAKEVRGVGPPDNRPTRPLRCQSAHESVSGCESVISPTVTSAGRLGEFGCDDRGPLGTLGTMTTPPPPRCRCTYPAVRSTSRRPAATAHRGRRGRGRPHRRLRAARRR